MNDNSNPTFPIGKVVCTVGADYLLVRGLGYCKLVYECLLRFINCDWGEVCDETKARNKKALEIGGLLLGVYVLKDAGCKDEPIQIVTDLDCETTTIIFPGDY